MKHTVSEVQLKNGVRGLLIDVPGASVMSYLIQFRAGNRYVKSDDIYETAHIMEHMAFGANAKFASANDFSAEFEQNGAYHNASTGDIGMIYMADCAEIEWERILNLQKIAITTPKFQQNELEAESGNVQEELTGLLSNHSRALWLRVGKAVGDPVMLDNDRLKTIANITVDDIAEHYKRTHTLNNMRFVIAGPLKGRKRKTLEMLEGWRLPKGERLDVPQDALYRSDPVLVPRKEVPNLIFGFGMFLNERIDDGDLDAMAALNHILTGTLHSRILGQARQRGLVYGMWSDTSAYDYMSEWSFGGQVSLAKAEKLFDIIVDELRRVLDGKLSAKEVEAAQQYALGKHQMACQTVAQIAHWYSGRYFFDEQIDNFDYRPRA
ncbi:hypothetical protein CYG49_04545, partial [Candidatus Saccharibacteria bacterium]